MRVDHVCDPAKVWTVLMDCWQLPVPRLLISVTGGAKRFYLRPRLKNILKQGLVSAAVSTGNDTVVTVHGCITGNQSQVYDCNVAVVTVHGCIRQACRQRITGNNDAVVMVHGCIRQACR